MTVGIFAWLIGTTINSVGSLKIDVLKKVSERSHIVCKAAISLAEAVDDTIDLFLKQDATLEHDDDLYCDIDEEFKYADIYYDRIGIDLTLTVIMKDNVLYMSQDNLYDDIDEMKRSFWYVNSYTNDRTELWRAQKNNADGISTYLISYVRILRDDNGQYIGVAIVNSTEKTFHEIYSNINENKSDIYILDENGVAISTKYPNQIGTQIYYMPAFEKEYGYNTYHVDYEKGLFISNYRDEETGWTFVQKSDLNSVFGEYSKVWMYFIYLLTIIIFLGMIASFKLSKKILKPLQTVENALRESANTGFRRIDVIDSYSEAYAIGQSYNEAVDEIVNLFAKIKEDERAKRKQELEFLQLQINPHFLHNTLFSIKCLINLGRTEQAGNMISSLLSLLSSKMSLDKRFSSIKSEAEMLNSYTEIMKMKYPNIKMEIYIDESVEECLIPRFLLQPVVENTFFHGMESEDAECLIKLFAYPENKKVVIKINDNGIGMTKEELDRIWDKKTDGRPSNHIGLKNVRERVKMVYGEECDVTISSVRGEGVEAEFILKQIFAEEELE